MAPIPEGDPTSAAQRFLAGAGGAGVGRPRRSPDPVANGGRGQDGGGRGRGGRAGRFWVLTAGRAAALLGVLRETVTVFDADGTILYTNRDGFLGYPPDAHPHLPVELVHPDEQDELARTLARCLASPGRVVSGEFRMLGADGAWKLVEGSALNLLDDPAIGGIVLITRNLSALTRPPEEALDRRARLQQLADRDPLTGLASRRHLEVTLQRLLERRRITGEDVAMACLGLGRYDDLVAEHGTSVADGMVMACAERLGGCVPPESLLCRASCDRFVVLVHGHQAAAVAAEACRCLADILGQPGLPPDGTPCVARRAVVVAGAAETDAMALVDQALARLARPARSASRPAEMHANAAP